MDHRREWNETTEDHKDVVSPAPQDEAPLSNDNESGDRDEIVMEYLRQRLAAVIARGSAAAAAVEPDVKFEEKSRFSLDLDDEEWNGYEVSEYGGSEAAYPNIRAEGWDDDGLDPAWIIDRYCSWQEEDLEDALMEGGWAREEEWASEVTRLLENDQNELEDEKNLGIGEDHVRSVTPFNPDSKDSYTMRRMERVGKTLPTFLSRSPSPSPLPSPRLESIYGNCMSGSNTLVELASSSTSLLLSPHMIASGDIHEPILTLDLLHDSSFHATTAYLLGPDFGCDVTRMARRFQEGQELVREREKGSTSLPTNSVAEVQPGDDSTFGLVSTNDDSVLKILESLDMSWKVFRSKASVQKYLSTGVPPDEPWDFGVCYDRGNGSQHCAVMHARGMKRTYTDHMIVREGVPAGNDVLAPGCRHLFWWCRPHPQWKEGNPELRARAKNLEEHYEEAKKRINRFKIKRAAGMKTALLQNYTQLLRDLPERERTTGRFSIHSMNTVLQLAEISELLDRLTEADDWNREHVRRRAKRLGRESIHTCHARYRHVQLLYKMEKYDLAGDVSKINQAMLNDFDDTYPLVAKQNILACAIALRRKRIDQAIQCVEHLWSLETNHPGDLETKEMALEVLCEAYAYKKEFAESEKYKRRQIEMYEGGYGKEKGKGLCYYHLAICLRRQEKFQEGVEASKKAISVYKEYQGAADEELFDAYQLLGNCLFGLREWNKARFYIHKAVKGYEGVLGSKADKTQKAIETLKVLEKNAWIKQGLAERLVQQKEKNRLKRKF